MNPQSQALRWALWQWQRAGRGCLLAALVWLAACSGTGTNERGGESAPFSSLNREQARGSLAAVKISGQSKETVRDTVDAVFTAAGFRRGRSAGDQQVFERPASRGQRAAYGNWQGGEVFVRLRVDLQRQGREEYFVTCRSFIVRGDQYSAEDEQPVARRRLREFRTLLDEVATRLN